MFPTSYIYYIFYIRIIILRFPISDESGLVYNIGLTKFFSYFRLHTITIGYVQTRKLSETYVPRNNVLSCIQLKRQYLPPTYTTSMYKAVYVGRGGSGPLKCHQCFTNFFNYYSFVVPT